MKTKNILMMLVAMLLILSSCDDAAFLTEPEISFSPSQPETETPSDTAGLEPLPDAYVMKGGKLRLYVGGDRKMNYYTDVGGIMFKGLTWEEVKEKFLTVNFTPEEIEHMQKEMADDGGYVYVPDPRLVTPLKLPAGCTQKGMSLSMVFDRYRFNSVFYMGTTTSEAFELGSSFGASLYYAAGATGNGETGVYDDYISIEELEDPTNGFKCYAEKNGRIYYIEYYVKEYPTRVYRQIRVDTFNCNHRYHYAINDPTEECIKNILDYDPFTYLQVEY